MHILKSSKNWVSPRFKMVNQAHTKYIGIIEIFFNCHPHSDVLKQGKETCVDQNWLRLPKMKGAEKSPLEGPKLPLTTKSTLVSDKATLGLGPDIPLPGENGGEERWRYHPGRDWRLSRTKAELLRDQYLPHNRRLPKLVSGLAGDPALPRRSLWQSNLLKGRQLVDKINQVKKFQNTLTTQTQEKSKGDESPN